MGRTKSAFVEIDELKLEIKILKLMLTEGLSEDEARDLAVMHETMDLGG